MSVSAGGVEPSWFFGGMAFTVAVFECCWPYSGAGKVALQKTERPGKIVEMVLLFVPGQVMARAGMTLSVTVMLDNAALPVLVTLNVNSMPGPSGTGTPGEVFASLPLMSLVISTPGLEIDTQVGSVGPASAGSSVSIGVVCEVKVVLA